MRFQVIIQPEAMIDIQDGMDYYNSKQSGLGNKFHEFVSDAIDALRTNPFYQIRYNEVRCLPLKKFPFMLHFHLNESVNEVNILAVINTDSNPETRWLK